MVTVEAIYANITSPAPEVTAFVYVGENLSCYHCEEDFKHFYEKNTPCQARLNEVDVRKCGASDRYCKVRKDYPKDSTLKVYLPAPPITGPPAPRKGNSL